MPQTVTTKGGSVHLKNAEQSPSSFVSGSIAGFVCLLVIIAALVSTIPIGAADEAQEIEAIKSRLLKPKTWTIYLEATDATAPSDRAQKFIFEYFRDGEKVKGRQLGLAFGGCDFELTIHRDGLSFPWCPPYSNSTSVTYHPQDPKFPFKNETPRKIWMQPND